MNQLFLAGMRSMRSLFRPGIFLHLLWPTLASIVFWGGIAAYFWTDAAAALVSLIQSIPLIGGWMGDGGVGTVLANILLVLAILPMIYVTASFLVAVVAVPLMLDRLANTDYRDLEMRRGGSVAGSIVNATWALLLFLGALLVSLPFWLIPGVGVVISILLSAWLNQRCYGYDALMNHADREEMRRIGKERRGGMYALGIAAGIAAFVPFFNLLVPALTGLVFVHYLLEALRVDRTRPMKTIY